MKFALYSDVHAQLPQFEAVLAAIEKEDVDKEVFVGDLVMLGPQPREIIEKVWNRPNCDVLIGNLDMWMVDERFSKVDKPRNEYHEIMLKMGYGTRERLDADHVKYLAMLPFALTYRPEPGHEMFVFHATPHEIGDHTCLMPNQTDAQVKDYIKGVTAEVLVHGHMHGPSIRQIDDQTIVDCAAVGMSWDGDPRPAYAIVEYKGDGNWDCRIERIDQDFEEQAKFNEESWIWRGEIVAQMIRTGYFWNMDYFPH